MTRRLQQGLSVSYSCGHQCRTQATHLRIEGTAKSAPPAATEAGKRSGEPSACERHHISDTVVNQAIRSTTDNNERNTDQNQTKLDERKGKQINKMGVRDEITAQKKALIPTAPVSAGLLPERPIAKRKAPVASDGDSPLDV